LNLTLFELTDDACKQRLSQEMHKGVRAVDLSNNKLTCVPAHCQRYPLEKLSLSHNTLADFSLCQRMPSLLKLALSGNGLTELPSTECLARLPNLQRLDVSNNRIREIAVHLPQHMTRLLDLNICSNELTCLPETITLLVCLEILDVSDNNLRTLPYALFSRTHFKALRIIKASNNELYSPPQEVVNQGRLAGCQWIALEKLEKSEVCETFKMIVLGDGTPEHTSIYPRETIVESSGALRIFDWTITGTSAPARARAGADPKHIRVWEFPEEFAATKAHEMFFYGCELYLVVCSTLPDWKARARSWIDLILLHYGSHCHVFVFAVESQKYVKELRDGYQRELGVSPHLECVEGQHELEARLTTLLSSENFRPARIKFPPVCKRVKSVCVGLVEEGLTMVTFEELCRRVSPQNKTTSVTRTYAEVLISRPLRVADRLPQYGKDAVRSAVSVLGNMGELPWFVAQRAYEALDDCLSTTSSVRTTPVRQHTDIALETDQRTPVAGTKENIDECVLEVVFLEPGWLVELVSALLK
jgi:hypothetical protein